MHKFHVNLALLVLAISAPSQAATEVEGELPIELARHFTGTVDLFIDLPTGFPDFAMPDGLQLMGSLDRGTGQVLILRRSITATRAQQALADAFTVQPGWTVLEQPEVDRTRRGFVQASAEEDAIELPVQLCHDTLGLLTINGSYLDDVVNVSLNRPVQNRPTACQTGSMQGAVRNIQLTRNAGTGRFMPILELPANVVLPPNALLRGSNFSGSQNDLVTTVSLQAKEALSAEELNSHFAEQLLAQGWRADGQWSGSVSTGSSWTRPPANDDEPELFGFLEIVNSGEGASDLSFRLIAR